MPALSSFTSLLHPLRPLISSSSASSAVSAAKRLYTTPVPAHTTTSSSPRRPLTPPSSSSGHTQSQSPLFKLPPELRAHIWAYVAGPSRSVDLGSVQGRMVREHAELGSSSSVDIDRGQEVGNVQDDIRGWETGLLLSCRRVYAEVLPVLLHAVRIRTFLPGVMIRLPELLPQSHTRELRDVEFVWVVSQPPYLGEGAKTSGKVHKTARKHAEQTETVLRAVCEVLGTLEGLERVRWVFEVPIMWRKGWAEVENQVYEIVNEARQCRQGWKTQVTWASESGFRGRSREYNGLRIVTAGHLWNI